MTRLCRTNFYICVLFLSVVYRLTNANDHEASTQANDSNEMTDSTTTKSATPAAKSTVNSSSTFATEKSTITVSTSTSGISNTSTVGNVRPPDASGPGWWLLVALLITIVFVIIGGVIFYYRQHSPYRRFLRNWRSRDDDTDNIILQLEQPEVTHGQWPPRISFT